MNQKLVVGQSGGATVVINASLAGVVAAANAWLGPGRVAGMVHGVEGALAGEFADLGRLSTTELSLLKRTPSAALGSCRLKLSDEDIASLLDRLQAQAARWFVYIGGNDSADTANRLAGAARSAGYDLQVVVVPKTIDNDLVGTDHCPGYGSIARYVASVTQEAGCDTAAMSKVDQAKIIEVMGRNTGWVAAAAGLAKRDSKDPPQIIWPAELPFSIDRFLSLVEDSLKRVGHATIVISETVRYESGELVGASGHPEVVDSFGHRRDLRPADVLCREISQKLGVRARWDRPGTLQRTSMAYVSEVDLAEAELAGREAVRALQDGHSGVMVSFIRTPGPVYGIETGLVPLEQVANRERRMPLEYLADELDDVTDAFRSYALPLVGELPHFRRLI